MTGPAAIGAGVSAHQVAPAAAGAAARADYGARTRRRLLIVAGLVAALAACLIVDIGHGPARFSPGEVLAALAHPGDVPAGRRVIVWQVRMPIALMAVVVGAALSVAGAQMQTVLNNPLASPFTLGVSAAASFGAALGIVLDWSFLAVPGLLVVPLNAFIAAFGATLLIYGLSRLRGASVERVVLLGIALVFTFNALLALLQYIASEQALQEVVFWTMGSLAKASWSKVAVTAVVLAAVVPFFVLNAWSLTALRLGEDKARSFGVAVERLRLHTLLLVSLLAAVAVAFVGTIGFVGLVGPHIARMLVGEDQRFFLPASAIAGALILSATSIVSKSIVPGVLFPIGIITALVGIPFFLGLVLSNRSRSWG